MFNKHKDRLYLVLEAKRNSQGYIWSVMLAPDDSKFSSGGTENAFAIKWEILEGPPRYWTFRSQFVNLAQMSTIVARICVAKFAEPQAARAQIEAILNDVPLEQDDADFKTRIWAMNAMEALRVAGIASYDATKQKMERTASDCANETIARISRSELTIKQPSDIPTLDMRW